VLIPIAVSGIYGSMIERRKQYAAAIKKAAERAAKNAKKKPQKPTKRLD
jgi:ribosomal protein S11